MVQNQAFPDNAPFDLPSAYYMCSQISRINHLMTVYNSHSSYSQVVPFSCQYALKLVTNKLFPFHVNMLWNLCHHEICWYLALSRFSLFGWLFYNETVILNIFNLNLHLFGLLHCIGSLTGVDNINLTLLSQERIKSNGGRRQFASFGTTEPSSSGDIQQSARKYIDLLNSSFLSVCQSCTNTTNYKEQYKTEMFPRIIVRICFHSRKQNLLLFVCRSACLKNRVLCLSAPVPYDAVRLTALLSFTWVKAAELFSLARCSSVGW